MATKPQYETFRLPTTLEPTLLRKFAILSADAVRASRKERMILFAHDLLQRTEDWAKRLQEPHLSHWILVAPNAYTGALSLAEGQWAGMYSFQGPLAENEMGFYFNGDLEKDGNDSTQSNQEKRWIGRSFYIHDTHRNLEAMMVLSKVEDALIGEYRAAHHELGPITCRIARTATVGTGSYGLQSAVDTTRTVKDVHFADIMEADGVMDQIPDLCYQAEYIWEVPKILFERVIHA